MSGVLEGKLNDNFAAGDSLVALSAHRSDLTHKVSVFWFSVVASL